MKRADVAALFAPLAVLAVQFAAVRPTNFSGYDEWLVVSLSSRGIVSVPYASRPLDLMWAVPAALLAPNDLMGYWLVHGLYIAVSGALTAWIAARLLPGQPTVALLAGVTAVAWAPLDYMRLDSVLLTRYSGGTAATMGATALFVAGWCRARPVLSLGGGALAALAVLAFEGTLPVLSAAPLLARAAAGPRTGESRRLLRWSVGWELLLLAAAAPLLVTLLSPGAASYQTSALGLDLHPGRLLLRVLRQFRDHLWPLVSSRLGELGVTTVAVAVAVFLLAALLVARPQGQDQPEDRSAVFRLLGLGGLLAALGWLALSLSPSVRTPARAQILSAPGVALLLAGASAAGALALPARTRRAVLVLAGVWMVAVGTGRTAAMQREWDGASFWPVQRDVLVQLTRAAPSLDPNTLVLLLDEVGAFPAAFTFHHAVHYLYGDGVRGHVWGAHEFLYVARFDGAGVAVEPWPVIRRAWRAPPTRHRFDELVVVRMGSDGRLRILERWPGELPPLPPGAAYAPLLRVRPAPPPPARRILERLR